MPNRERASKTRFNKHSHGWIWFLIIGSAFIAIALLAGSALALWLAPSPITEHSAPIWNSIKDIGPAVAGFWVVAAAIFTITAAGITILADAADGDAHDDLRKNAIRRACIGEISAFWDRMNSPEPLQTKLGDHIEWLKKHENIPASDFPDIFRRNLGDDWFLLSRLDPLAISELEELSGRYLALSGRARNLVGRFNWMNSADKSKHDPKFWIAYHNDTREVMLDVSARSSEMLRSLNETAIDPKTFSFNLK
jgi:hypothetical protein